MGRTCPPKLPCGKVTSSSGRGEQTHKNPSTHQAACLPARQPTNLSHTELIPCSPNVSLTSTSGTWTRTMSPTLRTWAAEAARSFVHCPREGAGDTSRNHSTPAEGSAAAAASVAAFLPRLGLSTSQQSESAARGLLPAYGTLCLCSTEAPGRAKHARHPTVPSAAQQPRGTLPCPPPRAD